MSERPRACHQELVRAALWRASHTRTARRWTRTIITQTSSDYERIALTAILLVEMTARPIWFRAVEWAVAIFARHAVALQVSRAAGARITVGPLQIAGGPWSRSRAVAIALDKLRCSKVSKGDTVALAISWNGAKANAPKPVAYSDVLQLALPLAIAMVHSENRPSSPVQT